jgi:archaetidylinositol phosphate synthase
MIKEKLVYWDAISIKLGEYVNHLPFSPNFYTWLSLPLALIGFIAIVNKLIMIGMLLFILAGLFDLLDGGLARYKKICTPYGAFLDGTIDRFVDFLMLLSFFWLPIQPLGFGLDKWLYIAGFFMIMPSYIVAYANHRQAVHDPSEKIIWRLLNRGEMFAIMILIIFISAYNTALAGKLLEGFVILSIITTLQAFIKTLLRSK